MEKYANAFSRAASRVSTAATKTIQEYGADTVPDETTFTPALGTRIKDALNGYSASGITWNIKYLSSHGPGSEEKRFGADFLGVLSLNLPGYTVKKGFFAQAKRQEPGTKLSPKEWDRLVEQCQTMLAFSPESFVFVYSLNGVFVVPAISVLACHSHEDLHTLHPKKIGPFYREHFECFVGDRRIDSASTTVLDNLAFRVGLEISAGLYPQQELRGD
jgi:hypothetical protein